jgi:hypothetical protein
VWEITPELGCVFEVSHHHQKLKSEQMEKRLVNPDRLYDSSPFGMSQAVVDTASSLVFVSGQVDWDHQYQVSHSSVPDQLEASYCRGHHPNWLVNGSYGCRNVTRL